MQQDSIERIRSATFSIARKGYEKREVERFLNKLADWLEAGGGDQARSDLVKRELGRVGEKTARILSEAEDSAEQLRTEAEEEGSTILGRAREQARSARESAEEYAGNTRRGADEYAKKVRHDADQAASELRSRTTSEARRAIDDAQAKARRIVEEGAKRRGDIEAVISDLVKRRDALLAGVDKMTGEMRQVIATHTPTGRDPFATPTELDPAARADGEGAPAARPSAPRDNEPATPATDPEPTPAPGDTEAGPAAEAAGDTEPEPQKEPVAAGKRGASKRSSGGSQKTRRRRRKAS